MSKQQSTPPPTKNPDAKEIKFNYAIHGKMLEGKKVYFLTACQDKLFLFKLVSPLNYY